MSILCGRLGVPMGLRRTFLLYNWTVLLVVAATSNVAVLLSARASVGRMFRRLMPCRGEIPQPRWELLSTDPDPSRQSILPPTADRPKFCECCTPLAARESENRAPSPARFVGYLTFSHPTFDSKYEILSILPVGQRLTPWLQKPLRRPVRPVLGRTTRRQQPSTRPDSVAKSAVLFQGRQKDGESASCRRSSALAFV